MSSPYRDSDIGRVIAEVFASETDAVLVEGIPGSRIRVLWVTATPAVSDTTLVFNSKGEEAGVAISPTMANAANLTQVLPYNPYGWFQTEPGEALTCTTGEGGKTGILVGWVEIVGAGS